MVNVIDTDDVQRLLGVQEAIVAITHWQRLQLVRIVLETGLCPYSVLRDSIDHHAQRRECTRHLRALVQCGVLEREKIGRKTYYSVNKDMLYLLRYIGKRYAMISDIEI